MWTAANRARYDRSKLRYPSDLTDAEWQLIGPLIPKAKRGGDKRTVDVREVVNGMLYVLSTGAASGGRSRRTCRRAALCTVISTCGPGMERSTAFTSRSTSNAASKQAARSSPRPPSLTAKA